MLVHHQQLGHLKKQIDCKKRTPYVEAWRTKVFFARFALSLATTIFRLRFLFCHQSNLHKIAHSVEITIELKLFKLSSMVYYATRARPGSATTLYAIKAPFQNLTCIPAPQPKSECHCPIREMSLFNMYEMPDRISQRSLVSNSNSANGFNLGVRSSRRPTAN
jgi:hypothetical protein